MVTALFINHSDNVPFERVYRSRKGFLTAVRNMKHASFKWAIDDDAVKIIYPEDIRRNKV